MITIRQWTLVRHANNELFSKQAYRWCKENLNIKDWDHNSEGFLFKHEQDAIMFALRWA